MRMNTAMRAVAMALCGLLAAACATSPTAPARRPAGPPASPSPVQSAPEGPSFTLQPARFADMPGFAGADLAPALAAFKRACAAIARAPDDRPLGRLAPYGGTVGQWRGACAAAEGASDAHSFFTTQFDAYQVAARGDQMRRLTGYYEPVLDARRRPDAVFSEPFLGRPDDLVGIDLSQFDAETGLSEAISEDVMRVAGQGLDAGVAARVGAALNDRLERRFQTPIWGRLTPDRRIVPYAARAMLERSSGVLAYARPCDVYDAQVQGSSRVRFEDGTQMRVAYAAQNGWRWRSIYPQLRDQGLISTPNKAAVCAYLGGLNQDAAAAALALDPSYVFFSLEPIADSNAGPRGAQGVALTALGSVAVDPAAHPYGAVLFAVTDDGAFARLLVAQDTGGAIRRGPLRGDVFFGTGPEAGAAAERMNAPVRFWTLLPKGIVPIGPAIASAR
jgi:membrane-bound lytic murein transglycosylase A